MKWKSIKKGLKVSIPKTIKGSNYSVKVLKELLEQKNFDYLIVDVKYDKHNVSIFTPDYANSYWVHADELEPYESLEQYEIY